MHSPPGHTVQPETLHDANGAHDTEVAMLCEELETLEGKFDEIVTALEDPALTDEQRKALEKAYAELSHTIKEHQTAGHKGGACFEE
jgi:hypothetical protein